MHVHMLRVVYDSRTKTPLKSTMTRRGGMYVICTISHFYTMHENNKAVWFFIFLFEMSVCHLLSIRRKCSPSVIRFSLLDVNSDKDQILTRHQ